MTEEQFNQWLTNGRGSPMQHFEIQLRGQLARLDKTCRLTAHQRQKLELAGRGDIARFQTEVTELQDRLVGKTYDQNQINEVYQQIQPLMQRVRKGILGEGSLFQKVMISTLEQKQLNIYERMQAERLNFQYRAKVKLFVAALDGTAPMLDEQRQALLELLQRTTRRPKRWGGDYDWYYVLYHASKAPRNELTKFLDAAQLRAFENAVQQGARYGAMLEREGMTPVDEAPQQEAERRADDSAAAPGLLSRGQS